MGDCCNTHGRRGRRGHTGPTGFTEASFTGSTGPTGFTGASITGPTGFAGPVQPSGVTPSTVTILGGFSSPTDSYNIWQQQGDVITASFGVFITRSPGLNEATFTLPVPRLTPFSGYPTSIVRLTGGGAAGNEGVVIRGFAGTNDRAIISIPNSAGSSGSGLSGTYSYTLV